MKKLMISMLMGSCLLSMNVVAANFSNIGTSTKLTKAGFSQQVKHQRYGDLPAYLVEMDNGKLIPQQLIVPANTKFRIIVRNIGNKPSEFESNQLRQEKVLYMGDETSVLIMPLSPGTYDYFDDFTPGAKGKIVAK